MDIFALGYLGFRTPEHAQWETFGPEVLGLGIAPRGPDGAVRLRMDDRHHRLSFHPGEVSELAYIGWELRGRREFAAALKELEEKGVSYELGTPEELAERTVTGMAHMRDPAGFRHEIFYSQQFQPLSFMPGRPISGFLCGSMGVGHVVLAVPDVQTDHLDFAAEVLQHKVFATAMLRMPNRPPKLGEFYRCNPRTHCMAYVTMEGLRGMTHFCIETLSLDDVGRALDLIEQRQIPLQRTLGRHTLDEFVSFYVRGPGGIVVEYGAGGTLLDDDAFTAQKPNSSEVWGHKYLIPEPAPTLHPTNT